MLVVIVVPVYKSYDQLNHLEVCSYMQLLKILGKHPICLACPEGFSVAGYINQASICMVNITHEHFDQYYFRNIDGYNDLMKNAKFYKRFQAYQYMLIYQLDAFVFRDELYEWCERGYDYIGAPLFSFTAVPEMSPLYLGIGNGGFSLRNIKKSHNIALHYSYIMKWNHIFHFLKLNRIISFQKIICIFYKIMNIKKNELAMKLITVKYNEDILWGLIVPNIFEYKVATLRDALKFSFEALPSLLYQKNNQQLPFGCHAWEKHEPLFWTRFINFQETVYT